MIGRLLHVLLFFFQAEDGIRDLVRSRGLGDVYKRQARLQVDSGDFGNAPHCESHDDASSDDTHGDRDWCLSLIHI